jgi:hypothetical protein
MRTISRVAHFLAWTFGALQLAVLLSTCLTGFSEMRLGLTVISQVAFFAFLFISSLADQTPVTVRTRVRHG